MSEVLFLVGYVRRGIGFRRWRRAISHFAEEVLLDPALPDAGSSEGRRNLPIF